MGGFGYFEFRGIRPHLYFFSPLFVGPSSGLVSISSCTGLTTTMSVLGLGVDIVRISRISRLLAGKSAQKFLQKVLHPVEIKKYGELNGDRAAQYVAGSWAAKEALFKTLDFESQKNFQFREWYRFLKESKPFLGKEGYVDGDFLLSISHDGDTLVATVLRQERKSQ